MQITVTINLQGRDLGAPVPAVFSLTAPYFSCAIMSTFVRKYWRNWSNKYKFSNRDQTIQAAVQQRQRLLHTLFSNQGLIIWLYLNPIHRWKAFIKSIADRCPIGYNYAMRKSILLASAVLSAVLYEYSVYIESIRNEEDIKSVMKSYIIFGERNYDWLFVVPPCSIWLCFTNSSSVLKFFPQPQVNFLFLLNILNFILCICTRSYLLYII